MYIISEHTTKDGKKVLFGEVLETGYYMEKESMFDLQEDLDKHDV